MKRTHLIVLEKPVVALADSREVRSMIADVERCEVTRQLRAFEARGENGTLRAVRDYACDVFGYTGKADHWLQMPTIHLDRECTVTWPQNHNVRADVCSVLAAIAYSTPV
ncbi:hypothetical protein G3N57_11025 [Paraburkholderia sp. Se-20369]|nr:hypothetical protein [Paraburkholderia sp. Se-20369]